MKVIDKAPEVPVKHHCKKHGEYEERYIDWFGGRVGVTSYCEECAKEQKLEEEAEQLRIHNENQAKRLQTKKRNAGISKRNEDIRFAHYIADTPEKELAKKKVNDMARAIYDGKEAGSLILTGKVGTGKTMLGCAAINAIIAGKSCRMVKMIDMFREIKETWRKDSPITELELIKKYSTVDLLVIDEAGVNYDSDTEKMFIFDIIDGRYQEMKPTIVITNLDMEELKKVMGDRVIDRLRDGGGEAVAFNWESARQ